MALDNFIELERTFRRIPESVDEKSQLELDGLRGIGSELSWDELLEERNVVLLSEAGSGKTWEIREKTKELRGENRFAFFLRLENIPNQFETSFEEGSFDEFTAWKESNEEAWFFFDSIDEARLKSFVDFENAIRTVAAKLGRGISRARILISGRVTAWRWRADLNYCGEKLIPAYGSKDQNPVKKFKVVTFTEIDERRVRIFAESRGVENVEELLAEIERTNAWIHTTRPLDLDELVSYWESKKKIGSRFDFVKYSIEKRLKERNRNLAGSLTLNQSELRIATRRLAAVTFLKKSQLIGAEDCDYLNDEISVENLLDLKSEEPNQVLSTRIFDAEIYGSVRFHHRAVREFLMSEWLFELLSKDTSRRRVESLLFRKQYGVDVIVPSLRPVIPWLAVMDSKIAERVYDIAPEVFFEGGDPSQLQIELRRRIIRECCERLADKTASVSNQEAVAVRQFAKTDLTGDLLELLSKHRESDEVMEFLLGVVGVAALGEALPVAEEIARDQSARFNVRHAAVIAVSQLGDSSIFMSLCSSFQNESENLNSELLATFLREADANKETLEWLLPCLSKINETNDSRLFLLEMSLTDLVENTPDDLLLDTFKGFGRFLFSPPFRRRFHYDVPEGREWMHNPICHAAEQLIQSRNPALLEGEALAVLACIQTIDGRTNYTKINKKKESIEELVASWSELNRAVFWQSVDDVRELFRHEGKPRPDDFMEISRWGSCWNLTVDDFDYLLEQFKGLSEFQDKKLVLSCLVQIYYRAEEREELKDAIVDVVGSVPEYVDHLRFLLNRIENCKKIQIDNKSKQERWEAAHEARSKNQGREREKWIQRLKRDVTPLQENMLKVGPTNTTQDIYNLFRESIQRDGNFSKYTGCEWKSLESDFGKNVTTFFRDATVYYWENIELKLPSERRNENSTSSLSIMALQGVEAERRDNKNFFSSLGSTLVQRACKLAAYELNGFASWFEALFEAHPIQVTDFLSDEIQSESQFVREGKHSIGFIHDVFYHGKFAFGELAPRVLSLLKREPKKVSDLRYLLGILNSSSLSNAQIAKLASRKCRTLKNKQHLAIWFAVWLGVQPTEAMDLFERKLDEIHSKDEQLQFSMEFAVSLIGERYDVSVNSRSEFKDPNILKRLYLTLREYISPSSDIERAGGGAYSPTLRDNAQHARETFFRLLLDVTGKEAFVAIKEIAKHSSLASYSGRIEALAHSLAERDSDITKWTETQVASFEENFEFRPGDSRQLYDIARDLLLDQRQELEKGEASNAGILRKSENETEVRNYLKSQLDAVSRGRFNIAQEEEDAAGARTDLRFLSGDAKSTVELKIADKWTGPKLVERMRNQLCGTYLKDGKVRRGIYLLVYQGIGKGKKKWELFGEEHEFGTLVEVLQNYWEKQLFTEFSEIDELQVIGIDLTVRGA